MLNYTVRWWRITIINLLVTLLIPLQQADAPGYCQTNIPIEEQTAETENDVFDNLSNYWVFVRRLPARRC